MSESWKSVKPYNRRRRCLQSVAFTIQDYDRDDLPSTNTKAFRDEILMQMW